MRLLNGSRILQLRAARSRTSPPRSARAFTTSGTLRSNATPNASSVSANEVSHFSALASSWWDPHGPSRLLHQMNPLRHNFISRCMASVSTPAAPPRKHMTFLDIGCGGGIFAESAARLPHTSSVVAIDPTPECIAAAQQHQRKDPALASKLKYLHTNIESLPLPREPGRGADVVTLFEVIEHVQRPTAFLSSCMQHVKPGGWFVLSTISRTWTSWLTTKVVAEYALGLVPSGTHDWAQYINAEEMQAWAKKQQGWGDIQTMGVIYVPGLGWREVSGSEHWGNYFFAIRRRPEGAPV